MDDTPVCIDVCCVDGICVCLFLFLVYGMRVFVFGLGCLVLGSSVRVFSLAVGFWSRG
jgi:hypothetical protein